MKKILIILAVFFVLSFAVTCRESTPAEKFPITYETFETDGIESWPSEHGTLSGPDEGIPGKRITVKVTIPDPSKWEILPNDLEVNYISKGVTPATNKLSYTFIMPKQPALVMAKISRILPRKVIDTFDLVPISADDKNPSGPFPMSVDYNKDTTGSVPPIDPWDHAWWGNDGPVWTSFGYSSSELQALTGDELTDFVYNKVKAIGPRSGYWYGGAGEGQVRDDVGRNSDLGPDYGACFYYSEGNAENSPNGIGFGRTISGDTRNVLPDWDISNFDKVTVWAGEFNADGIFGTTFTLTILDDSEEGEEDDPDYVPPKEIKIPIVLTAWGEWQQFEGEIPEGFGTITMYMVYLDDNAFVEGTGELWVDDIYAVRLTADDDDDDEEEDGE
jgi:hypothetical protein